MPVVVTLVLRETLDVDSLMLGVRSRGGPGTEDATRRISIKLV